MSPAEEVEYLRAVVKELRQEAVDLRGRLAKAEQKLIAFGMGAEGLDNIGINGSTLG